MMRRRRGVAVIRWHLLADEQIKGNARNYEHESLE